MWPLAVTVVCLVAIGVGGFLYFTKLEMRETLKELSAGKHAAPAPSKAAASAEPVPVSAPTPITAPATAASAPPSTSPISPGEKFVAAAMPFVADRTRNTWATEYAAASDHKALALNINGITAPVTSQPDD